MTGHVAPRRPGRTYRCSTFHGREVYADTGRPVDENLGSHIVLSIVDDPEILALALEAEGDAEPGKWPKKQRHIGEYRKTERYESAVRTRGEGPRRSWYGHYRDAATAHSSAASLQRSAYAGIRYEVAEITDWGACPDCHQPTVYADGQWRHHTGRYPAECAPKPEPAEEEPQRPADVEEWWEIGSRYMICGYCGERVHWHHTVIGYAELTGYHLLAIHKETGDLVVIAEAAGLAGNTVMLPHECKSIPARVYSEYAADIRAVLANQEKPS